MRLQLNGLGVLMRSGRSSGNLRVLGYRNNAWKQGLRNEVLVNNNVRFFIGGLVNTKRNVNISRHLPFHHTDVFSVVKDVQKYPEFLPYCSNCKVLEALNENSLVAALTFEHRLLSSRETVTYDVSWDEPKAVVSVAENTTFCKAIAYSWHFTPRINGCLAEVEMELDFHSPSTAILFDSFSNAIKKTIMEAFVQRLKDSKAPMLSTES
uniref:Coenzyme Q-binding protein COQ10 START domain-containing protein n=1 Tax=Aplanochytrium stocchinoi TaxID=215587 RepID=A0A6S8D481_9STRA|mmetsp:Transcript_1603/g.2070  ORF Transcript_1603/g.2070 Transcript_1603/m.2070 type:complete len:209 (+) Transcript_1603:83-709(+)